jgi:hypothetical protein
MKSRPSRRSRRRRTKRCAAKPCPVQLRLEALDERSLPSAGFLQINLVSEVAGLVSVSDVNLLNSSHVDAGAARHFSDSEIVVVNRYDGRGQFQPSRDDTSPACFRFVDISPVLIIVDRSETGSADAGLRLAPNGERIDTDADAPPKVFIAHNDERGLLANLVAASSVVTIQETWQSYLRQLRRRADVCRVTRRVARWPL